MTAVRHTDSREFAAMEAEELLRLYKETGDEQVKWEIVLRYEHVVKHAALQVRGIYSGFAQIEDIINEGLIALLKSIDKFDIDKGVKFETFVSKRIRGMVVDLARKQDWVPRNVRKRAKEIDDVTMTLANELGRYPSNAEIAKELQISEGRLQKDIAGIVTNNVVSLEALMDANEMEGMHFEIASRDESGLPDFVLEE
ncbi:MAG: FliA/WhiG family RNA polymerase sigma factor, partial [Oscillospiraceae bacterium]|nr:FliA/WhiG family RNA polymerase sigma factor [Oscillospiraceae bacterium]